MNEIKETIFSSDSDNKFATVTSNERKWITKIRKLAEQRPDEVKIVLEPEDNFGYMLVHLPKSYMKLSPPHTKTMTDEQRAAAAERLKKARIKKNT